MSCLRRFHLVFLTALLSLSAPAVQAQTPAPPAQSHNAVRAHDLDRLPLSFESNRGQADAKVRFLTHNGPSTLFLAPSEAVFTRPLQRQKPARERISLHSHSRATEKRTESVLRMQLVGSDPKATVLEQQALPGRVNYLIGKDPSKWHQGVPTFGRVGFKGVYPGVDVVYYGNQRHLEYDFLVAPHADTKQIRLHFAGAQGVHINPAGELVVRAAGREVKWQRPAVYQQDAKGKHAVAARFRLKRLPDGQTGVSFALGSYDTDRALVIDPVLLYSTYLGGGTSDHIRGIAIDVSHNIYVTGDASSIDFPITAGALQTAQLGGTNAFVTKLNAAGTALIYSTYLGGHGMVGDTAYAIAIDSSGNAYVTGNAGSDDFPITPGAFQNVNGSFKAFVTKLNATGTALIYSTYLGGITNGISTTGLGIAIDASGFAYVVGDTSKTDFPVTPNAFQQVNKGFSNAFVTKFNATGTALIYSTYLGGTKKFVTGGAADYATAVAIDSSGNAYVTGNTDSQDFPVTPGAFQQVNKSSSYYNAFVTKLNATGTALIYSTYLGENVGTQSAGIAIDSSGNAYITGHTNSTNFPVTPGAFQQVNKGKYSYGPTNAFVTKLNSAGTALLYSTFLGGSSSPTGDFGTGITIDNSGNAYITGQTTSTDFPVTPGAFQPVNKNIYGTPFVTKLNATGAALLYSTYLGGTGDGANRDGDTAYGIAIDSNGDAYVAGAAYSEDFPVTPGAFQITDNTPSGEPTGFVTKLHPVRVFPDFNNDGNTDLFIQNASTGVIASWFMQGSQWLAGAYFSLTPPTEFALVGAGDFSGTGATTLVLQSKATNQIAFWYTSGTNHATIAGGNFVNQTPPSGWKVVGVGDFNADGKSDLVLQNQTTNQVAIWFMNGYLYNGGVLMPFTPPAGWTVAGAGDFNLDGFTDLVFQNQTTGQIAIWYMNGTTYVGGTVLTTVPTAGWKVVGVGDYNGDGSADLLFQNQTSNQAAVWYIKNGAFAGGDTLSLAPPSGWKIVGPR